MSVLGIEGQRSRARSLLRGSRMRQSSSLATPLFLAKISKKKT
jgi:hypothetical protein